MKEIHIPKPPLFHRAAATATGATMWFLIFYKLKNEGDVLMVAKLIMITSAD